jgi:hypothetical protein
MNTSKNHHRIDTSGYHKINIPYRNKVTRTYVVNNKSMSKAYLNVVTSEVNQNWNKKVLACNKTIAQRCPRLIINVFLESQIPSLRTYKCILIEEKEVQFRYSHLRRTLNPHFIPETKCEKIHLSSKWRYPCKFKN